MKIMWLCNVEIPQISRILGKTACVYGGWLSQTADRLVQEHRLHVLYPDPQQRSGQEGNLSFCSFSGQRDEEVMEAELKGFQPQVIHIWGTEVKHSNDLIRVVERCGMTGRCVVSIQGLVSFFAGHYTEGVPEKVVRRYTLRDRVRSDSIADQQRSYARRGELERDTFRRSAHVIGRTEWDRTCAEKLNPGIQYHFCNETLRSCFYQGQWSPEGMERHSIFSSRSNYTIKGFHFLLEAMPDILSRYPDAVVYTTGPDLLRPTPRERLLRTSYQVYLADMIRSLHLEEHVRFLGTLDEEQMRERYLKSNVFVCPSILENSSNSIGEAMLLGCPVVASYVGGTMSMMTHGQEGFLYQTTATYMLAGYVNRIFGDDALAMRLSQNGRKRAAVTHDPEINHQTLLEIYRSLCGK